MYSFDQKLLCLLYAFVNNHASYVFLSDKLQHCTYIFTPRKVQVTTQNLPQYLYYSLLREDRYLLHLMITRHTSPHILTQILTQLT